MVSAPKRRLRFTAVLPAFVMVMTIWFTVSTMGTSHDAYAADNLDISWGWGFEDENAGYLLFDYAKSGAAQVKKTAITLPDGWAFSSTAAQGDFDVSKLPAGLQLTGVSFDGSNAELTFTYSGGYIFDGEIGEPKKPRAIGVLDIKINPKAIINKADKTIAYGGVPVPVSIVAEVAEKWEIPYGARMFREMFNTLHTYDNNNNVRITNVINYFQGATSDWTHDVASSNYWMKPDFYEYGGKYGSLRILPGFKTQQQATSYSCGVVSSFTVLDYWNKREVTQVNGKPLNPPVLLNEQDLSKLRTPKNVNLNGNGNLNGDRSFFGATRQSEVVNIFTHMQDIYGQPKWNIVSGYDFEPLPTIAPAEEQAPRINVLTGKYGSGQAKYDMSFFDAVPWYIDHGVPVIIGWLGWGGHYQVIIGYDDMATTDKNDDVVILFDAWDTVDHKLDGYLIKSYKKLIDDWSAYHWGEKLGRFVFCAAWPNGYDIENAKLEDKGATIPWAANTNGNIVAPTVIKGTDAQNYKDKVTNQLNGLAGWKPIVGTTEDLNHKGSPYWKTDMDKITEDKVVVTKLSIGKYSDFETLQASAKNLDGPASLLMTMNYFTPTGMMTDIDLAKLKGAGKELNKTTLTDMLKIVDELNKESIKKTGKPAWSTYSTFDMHDGKEFFGTKVTSSSVIQTALANNIPLMTMAHEGGDQWNVAIGIEDVAGDDAGSGCTLDNVLINADPVDTSDHCRNGLSLYQLDWLIYDWRNSIGSPNPLLAQPNAASPDKTFLAVWPYEGK